jgi:hypothetical protein
MKERDPERWRVERDTERGESGRIPLYSNDSCGRLHVV